MHHGPASMNTFKRGIILAGLWVLGWWGGAVVPASGAPHRATHLGNPATRFAPPLQRPEDLRRLFANESLRADVESVLRQASWRGNLEDLRRAAATAPIEAVKLPKGSRMPFMSTRRNGKAIALIDVIWEGKDPIEAYAFEFTSSGRVYRCITPKPCSNFFVVDLGPIPMPLLALEKIQPASVSRCDPIPVVFRVRNDGKAPAEGVVVADLLPEGWRTADGQVPRFEAGTLAPGQTREFQCSLVPSAAGTFTNRARATSADGRGAEAVAVTSVRAPALALRCEAPADIQAGRPIEVCLTLSNTGDAPEPKATIRIPVPAGATVSGMTEGGAVTDGVVVWDLPEVGPGAAERRCATFMTREPGALGFAATAQGACSPAVESRCESRVAGIGAILLEVIDLADPVEVGNAVTYEIKVLNQGNGPLTRIRLAASIPEGQEFESGSGASAVKAEAGVITTEPVAELAPKAEAVWRMVLKTTKVGDIRFKVDLTADQFPRPVEEYEATSQY